MERTIPKALGRSLVPTDLGEQSTANKVLRAGHLLLFLVVVHSKMGRLWWSSEFSTKSLPPAARGYRGWWLQHGRSVLRTSLPSPSHQYYRIRTVSRWMATWTFRVSNPQANLLFSPNKTMIERAVAVFSRSKYHIAHHARALFLKYKVLKRAEETNAADQALVECTSLHRQIIPGDSRTPQFLSQADFDQLLPAWFGKGIVAFASRPPQIACILLAYRVCKFSSSLKATLPWSRMEAYSTMRKTRSYARKDYPMPSALRLIQRIRNSGRQRGRLVPFMITEFIVGDKPGVKLFDSNSKYDFEESIHCPIARFLLQLSNYRFSKFGSLSMDSHGDQPT